MISEFLASLFLASLPTPLVCFASLRPSLSSFHRFRLLSLTQPFNQFISSGTDDSGGCLRAMISWIRLAPDRHPLICLFIVFLFSGGWEIVWNPPGEPMMTSPSCGTATLTTATAWSSYSSLQPTFRCTFVQHPDNKDQRKTPWPCVSFQDNNSIIVLQESPAPPAQLYYPSPNVSRPASQLTEEEQIKIAQRIGLIQHLPTGTYDGCKKNREWVERWFKSSECFKMTMSGVWYVWSSLSRETLSGTCPACTLTTWSA